MLDKLDKQIIAILTLIYIVISFINFGNLHLNNAAWIGSSTQDHLTLTFNKPTRVAKIYFDYGLITGKYHFSYITANGQAGKLVDKSLDSFPNHYKWGHLYFDQSALIRSITVDVDTPEVEFKQLALFDDQGKYLTDFTLSSSRPNTNLNNLVTSTAPNYMEHNWLSSTAFDEIYYVSSAEQYLRGQNPYVDVQPQLGILLIALALALFGVSPFAWRLIPNISSILLVPLMYILAKKIFKCRKLATISTILMMCEFMHFTIGRLALLDPMLTLFVFIIYFFLFCYVDGRCTGKNFTETLKYLYGTGVFLGLGMAIKLNALFATPAILFCLVYCELVKTKPSWKITSLTTLHLMFIFIVIPLSLFILSYIPYANIMHAPNLITFVIGRLAHIYEFNFDGHLNGITYGYSSPWWSWPLLLMPQSVYYWQDSSGYMSSSIALMGNPAIYWGSIPAFAILSYVWFREKNYQLTFILVAILAQYLPYILVKRISFIYYFYSVTPFIILALAYIIKLALEKPNKLYHYLAYAYLAICIVLFLMYFPLISGIEVPRSYTVHYLLLLKSWNI